MTLRRPRLLYLSEDPPGSEKHLLDTLRAAQFEIDTSRGVLPLKLDDYQLVVFNNWDLESLPVAQKTGLEDYVKQGGGLLVIGGERNVYVEAQAGSRKTRSNARCPPGSRLRARPRTDAWCWSSTSRPRWTAARWNWPGWRPSASSRICARTDMIGVLMFDNTFRWVAPIRQVEDGARSSGWLPASCPTAARRSGWP